MFIALSVLEYKMEEKKIKKVLLILIKATPFIILFILNTFKAENVGYDALAYHYWYDDLVNGIPPGGSYPSVEIGFKFVIELFSKTKAPYLVFYAFMNLIVYGTTGYAIIKLSKNSALSALVYSCLSVMVLNFSALRQSLALGIVFLSVVFLIKKKWWSYLVYGSLVIIAGLFHKSAFVFLICLPLVFLKLKPFYLFYITPFIVLFFILTPALFQSIYYLTGSMNYMPTYREGVGEYYFIFYLIFVFFTLLTENNQVTEWIFTKIETYKGKIYKKSSAISYEDYQPHADENSKTYLLMFLLGVLFQATSRVNYAAPRLATQFLMISSLFIPNILGTIKYKKFKIILIGLVCLFFYLFFMYDSIIPNYLGVNPFQFL